MSLKWLLILRQYFGIKLEHGPQYLNAAQEFALNSPKEHVMVMQTFIHIIISQLAAEFDLIGRRK